MHIIPDSIRQLLQPTIAWVALLAGLALAVIGVLAIGGTSAPGFATRQLAWLGISIVVMVAVMLPHPKFIGSASYILMAITLGLLVVLLVPGIPQSIAPTRNNARCWLAIPGTDMLLQPSEFAKIAFILALAWYLRFRDNYRTLLGLLPPFVIMFIPVILILKEPDLGSALVFPPALFFVLVAAGAKMKHILALLGLGVLVVAVNVAIIYTLPENMQILKKYQRERITHFVKLEGFQQRTAVGVLASGGVTGYGKERSAIIVRYNLLPEDHNDMIYPVIVNRWGLLGGVGVLGLFATVVLSILIAATRMKDPFARLACIGFAGILFCQTTVNIGMTIGLLPITGITLPFVSYGGSSLLSTFIMIGLVVNFAARRPNILARPSFEFDNPDLIFQ